MTAFTGRLVLALTDWLPLLPRVDARLRAEPPARVADLASGDGWFAVSLARSYPLVIVDGWDDDDGCIAHARRTAAAVELEERVRFELGPAGAGGNGRFDLVTASAAPERGADPILLAAAGRLAVPDTGIVVVADPRPAHVVTGAARSAGFADVRQIAARHPLVGVWVFGRWQNSSL